MKARKVVRKTHDQRRTCSRMRVRGATVPKTSSADDVTPGERSNSSDQTDALVWEETTLRRPEGWEKRNSRTPPGMAHNASQACSH